MLSTKKLSWLFVFVMLLAGTPVLAQQQQTMNLDSVLQRISANNPMLQQHNYRAKAMDAYAEGAKSWMAPMVGGGVYMAPYPGAEVMTESDKGSLMVSAEQDIPNPIKQRAKEKYMKSRAGIEQAAKDVTYNDLRAQAKTAYYNWVVLEKQLSVLKDNERIMEYMLKLARIRYPYSRGKLGGVYKAEARLHEVQNMQVMTASQIEQQNVQLNMLMNLPKDQKYKIDTTIVAPAPAALAVDTTYLASSRSDIRQLDRTIQSMHLNVEMEKKERLPDFSLRFDHMSPRDPMMPQQFTAMGMISIPIAPWSSKMYKANTKAMNLEIQAMQSEREAMLNEAQGMARNMALELNTMRQQAENYNSRIIPALKKNYDVTMLAYEQNNEELPLVIDAWEALNMAQMEYLKLLQSLYQMTVSYEKEIER
ncbi:TolC family protein [Pontibacter sp. BT310]|uniref:TolC family protein n=1 Tax=Pontibacter populi TaxID=890055 RepID=A0ABS6XG47_9BACT|nr:MULTISPECIES: TolC family protein [Pontibacter]MBJ6120104.1 TolC family protein [Pontibacter sp. BT310]MBR0572537.1 TolC family protein [Microvirga sp. STS03]MBW3366957.1 TolC family protein [Pontibacter populi]